MNALQIRCEKLRLSLFEDAVRKDLADIGDDLVQRKKTGGGRTVKEKHIDDSWLLVGAITRCECVPRILLKNGTRARDDLLKSQAKLREKRNGECCTTDVFEGVKNDAQDNGMEDKDNGKILGGAGPGASDRMLGVAKSGFDWMLDEARPSADRTLGGARLGTDGDAGREFGGARSHGEGDVGTQNAGCQNAVFLSTVVESINALREDVANLRSELGEIKRSGASVSSHRAPGKLCTLYVRVPEGGSEVSHIDWSHCWAVKCHSMYALSSFLPLSR